MLITCCNGKDNFTVSYHGEIVKIDLKTVSLSGGFGKKHPSQDKFVLPDIKEISRLHCFRHTSKIRHL
jgi:hypothetical protein